MAVSTECINRLRDWVLWYHGNKDTIPKENLQKRQEFLEKGVDGCFEMVARCLEEVDDSGKSESLWLPRNLELTDPLRQDD